MKPYSSKTQEYLLNLINEQYQFLQNDEDIIKFKKMLSPEHFMREFGTLTFKGRRQIGLTHLVEMLFVHTYFPSVIITAKNIETSYICRHLFDHLQNPELYEKVRKWVIPISWLKEYPGQIMNSVEPNNFKLCILENASFFTQEQIDFTYAIFGPRVTMFTLLG